MKKRLKVIIALIVAVAGFFAVVRYGNTRRIEWDVSSGRQRTVSKFIGIPTYGEPESTRLSEWKGGSSGEPKWVAVSSSSSVPPGTFVTPCSFKLLEMDLTMVQCQMYSSEMSEPLDTKEAKKVIADFILDSLRDGTEICDVLHMLRHSPMMDHRRDFRDRPITMSELRSLGYEQNKTAMINPRPL